MSLWPSYIDGGTSKVEEVSVLMVTPPSRLTVGESEYGQSQTLFVPLGSWVTLSKLSMSCLPEFHTHLEPQIVALCGNEVSADVIS